MKIQIHWVNVGKRAVLLGLMLAAIALGAGEVFNFVYQAY